MEFRPCIDIHNGKVKQIVGSSLQDEHNTAKENFVAARDASYYATLYKNSGLKGGHIILLNAVESEYYQATRQQALMALAAYPGGMQIGGGITPQTAKAYLDAGASHVIVTSYVFRDGAIHYDRIREMQEAVGKEHLVLDLSCKKTDDGYYIMTDRWQRQTKEKVTLSLLENLSGYCDEFLIHAVDVEGKNSGIEEELAAFLSDFTAIPVTYAGGVHSMEDLSTLQRLGQNRLNVTIGSALDLFGGGLPYEKIVQFCKKSI